jgi:hypothetical protein
VAVSWPRPCASIRSDITDWTPLLKLPAAILVIEAILPLVAVAALFKARSWRRVPVRDVAVLAVLAVATYRVGRVDAFLQAAIAVFLAQPIRRVAQRHRPEGTRPVPEIVSRRRRHRRRPRGLRRDGRRLAVAAGRGQRRLDSRSCRGGVPPREQPRGARPHWFDWGEYALWQLSPAGIRVSMDGRRETVYSTQVIHDHERFYQGHADMVDYPDRIGADRVWLPSRLPIIEPLKRRGWIAVLDTGRSVVLERGHGPDAARTLAPHRAARRVSVAVVCQV